MDPDRNALTYESAIEQESPTRKDVFSLRVGAKKFVNNILFRQTSRKEEDEIDVQDV